MRKLCCCAAWLVAVVAGVVTVPVGWVATHVADEDGYVSFTEPLASDAEFQDAISVYLGEEIATRTGLPPSAQPVVAKAIRSASARLVDRPGYVKAWDETQRRSHRLVFGDIRDLPAEQDGTDRFSIDLGPLAGYVVAELGDALSVDVRPPGQLLVAVNGSAQRDLIDKVKATPSQAMTGLTVMVLAVALTVLLAVRRSVALTWLGIGALGVAGGLKLVADAAVPKVLDRSSAPSDLARTLQELLADRALASFEGWLLWIAVGGGVVVALGLLMRAAGGRRA